MSVVAMESILAARDGDAAAFAAIVRAETPAAYRLALSIVRSPTGAEDAVQEAFLRAWRDLGKLRDPALWAAWFRRLTVRASLDETRRRRGIREVDLEAVSPTVAQEVGLNEADRLTILRAFDHLDAGDRAVLALRFYADLEVSDVAAALGIPLGTAKSRIHRALGRLRSELRE